MKNRILLAIVITILSIPLFGLDSSNIANASKGMTNQNKIVSKFTAIFADLYDMSNAEQAFQNLALEQQTKPKEKKESPKKEDEVLILMYHHLMGLPVNDSTITPKDFRDQMVWMKNNNFTFLSMKDLYDIVYNGKTIPPKAVVVTFDDGYRSVYDYAFPIAKELEIPMAFFVILKSLEDKTGIPKVTKAELKEMHESGYIYIGNHTYDMHYKEGIKAKLAKASKDEIIVDIQKWLTNIEHADLNLRAFAYPYGKYSNRTLQALREMNYKLSFTVKPGVYKKGSDPLKINRVNAGGKEDTLEVFIKKVEKYTKFNLK